jgi:O-antigen/teichoic acid export membrane protein
MFSWQLPLFTLNAFFAPSIAGYYAFGFRILQMPMSLLGTAIGQVFYQRATIAQQQGTLSNLVEDTYKRLTVLGLFPMLVLSIIGRDLFSLVFGASWAEAGTYVQILSPWAFFWFISSPLSTVFNVVQCQEDLLKWNIQNFLWRFFALIIGGLVGIPRVSVALFSFVGIVLYSYSTFRILHISGISFYEGLKTMMREFLTAAPALSILLWLSTTNYSYAAKVTLTLVICGSYYPLRIFERYSIIKSHQESVQSC